MCQGSCRCSGCLSNMGQEPGGTHTWPMPGDITYSKEEMWTSVTQLPYRVVLACLEVHEFDWP